MRAFDFIILIAFILLAAGAMYWVYLNMPHGQQQFIPSTNRSRVQVYLPPEPPEGTYEKSNQFYPNMRFPESEIGYQFDSACTQEEKNSVINSFEILEEKTILSFNEDNPRLMIICAEDAPEPTGKDHYVAGEGGPTEVFNTTLFAVITEARISLYREERCDSPHIALHEILHALGFDHNDDPGSILYPTLDCDQTLDDYLVEDINSIYSVKSAPDLEIGAVNVTKSGRYISFDIEITNRGLQPAQQVILEIYTDNSLLRTFDLEQIEIGTKKILNVENVRASSSVSRIAFEVRQKNNGDEIYDDNNRVELELTE